MTTIATNILRDLDTKLEGLKETSVAGGGYQPSPRKMLLDLCEAAEGIRLGASEWIFADGSELQV
jgi:hypothetical protein